MAKKNAKEEQRNKVLREFYNECAYIAEQCVEEGYPSHGENYDLRVSELENWYKEMYPDIF